MSIRVRSSILMTSAPKSASVRVASAPTPIQQKSATRTPASGPRRGLGLRSFRIRVAVISRGRYPAPGRPATVHHDELCVTVRFVVMIRGWNPTIGVDMRLDLSADELLTTTRSVRKRLDLDRPVEREVVEECLHLALQAPSGGNRQAWHWVFVTEPGAKKVIAEHYRTGFEAAYGSDIVPEMTDREKRMWLSARYLADHFDEVPIMLIPCQWGRVEGASNERQAGYW